MVEAEFSLMKHGKLVERMLSYAVTLSYNCSVQARTSSDTAWRDLQKENDQLKPQFLLMKAELLRRLQQLPEPSEV